MVTQHRLPLRAEPAVESNVALFGMLISPSRAVAPRASVFYDGTVNYQFDFISDADTTLILSSCQPRPLTVRYMERHFKHTQTFIPLGGKPFVMVLAPPNEKQIPAINEARALVFDGSAGFMLHVGTWHEFPFALMPDTDVISVLRQETYTGVSAKNPDDGEAHNPDLDKKDIARRLGVEIVVSVEDVAIGSTTKRSDT